MIFMDELVLHQDGGTVRCNIH